MIPADKACRRPGPTAVAVVSDELDRLPRVDDRYRLWPWSLRALAQRRRCSPGTVYKHHQALSAAGVLVTDDDGRTLVDTARLDEVARTRARPPSTCRQRRRSPSSPHRQWSNSPPVAGGEADVLVAIEALTSAVEARPDLAGVLAPMIWRLARLLEDLAPDAGATPARPSAAPRARGQERGARGHHGGPSGSDQGRHASTTGAVARRRARDRAPSKKERETQDSLFDNARDSDLPRPSLSSDDESRANASARQERDEGRAVARPADRLLELLGPLDPARHVTYLEGVQTALAVYDDDQVTYAVDRIAQLGPATVNPVGLLVDRAKAGDALYFPLAAPGTGDTPAVAELPDLWRSCADPVPAEPLDASSSDLPAFDPDPALASVLAARAALDAAHQPATRDQLAARHAALDGPETVDGGPSDAGRAA